MVVTHGTLYRGHPTRLVLSHLVDRSCCRQLWSLSQPATGHLAHFGTIRHDIGTDESDAITSLARHIDFAPAFLLSGLIRYRGRSDSAEHIAPRSVTDGHTITARHLDTIDESNSLVTTIHARHLCHWRLLLDPLDAIEYCRDRSYQLALGAQQAACPLSIVVTRNLRPPILAGPFARLDN